jgi:hypothetical protein
MLKAMFVFALLDRGSMAVNDVEPYVGRVPCYREVADKFLGLDSAGIARMLLGDLERARAIGIRDGVAYPEMEA